MKLGDYRTWLTEELYKNLEKVVNMKADYKHLYYIQVQFENQYRGPAAACENEVVEQEFKDVEKVMSSRLVIMNNPPAIPQFGTILFSVDNRDGKGELRHAYTLPFDKPNDMEDSDNSGEVVPLVAETAQHMPVMF